MSEKQADYPLQEAMRCKVSAEEVKAYRDSKGIGLKQALTELMEAKEQDEFKDYMVDKGLGDCDLDLKLYMRMVWNHRQDKIDAQTAEIAALRGFAEFVLAKSSEGLLIGAKLNWILLCGETNKLIDKKGNPTKLLTGDE